MTKLMQYSTRAVSHVTSKNRRTKPTRAIVLANVSTMFTEVLKYSSNLLFRVVVSWWMIYRKVKKKKKKKKTGQQDYEMNTSIVHGNILFGWPQKAWDGTSHNRAQTCLSWARMGTRLYECIGKQIDDKKRSCQPGNSLHGPLKSPN